MLRNNIIIKENCIEIELVRKNEENRFCIIDKKDYNIVKDYRWKVSQDSNTFYVQGRKNGKGHPIPIHRVLFNLTDSKTTVDHINGNGLDNRRQNLRVCTQLENNKNAKIRKDNTSGYKGVHKMKNRYSARIQSNGKRITIGYYDTAEDAAKAYNDYSLKLHGNYGKLNEIN